MKAVRALALVNGLLEEMAVRESGYSHQAYRELLTLRDRIQAEVPETAAGFPVACGWLDGSRPHVAVFATLADAIDSHVGLILEHGMSFAEVRARVEQVNSEGNYHEFVCRPAWPDEAEGAMKRRVTKLRLSPAAVSALQCSGLWEGDGSDDEHNEGLLRASVARAEAALYVSPGTRDGVLEALTALANSEDALARDTARDGVARSHARQACRALTALQGRVVKLVPARREPDEAEL